MLNLPTFALQKTNPNLYIIMEIKEIRELIKFVSLSGVAEVELNQGDFKLVIKTTNGMAPMVMQQQPIYAQAPQQIATPIVQNAGAPEAIAAAPVAESAGNTLIVKSPMIGTFYRSGSPDKPPFFNVGDEIKVGSVVCVIEAMKLFNEIESDVAGRIVKVMVDNANPVEYDQPLFLVEPV